MLYAEKIKLILLEDLLSIQAKNPSYSLRAYSKRLGISHSAISEMISGKRTITAKAAEKILQGLDKSPEQISQILNSSKEQTSESKFKSLDMDTYHLIADWHYFAILSLTETEGFQSSELWIAKRLGISIKTATEALQRLQNLGLVERDSKTKKIKPTGDQFEAVSAVAKPALKKACRQNLELAQKALEETQFNERDFTAITLCFDPARMDEAKEQIKKFRRKFCDSMESKKKKEVYKLTVALFPLTKGNL